MSTTVDQQDLVFVPAAALLICTCVGGCSRFATLVGSSYLCLEVEGDEAVNCVKTFDLKKKEKKT
jgi:hypothetical protein